jgi:nicotinamide-nucleotide amidase
MMNKPNDDQMQDKNTLLESISARFIRSKQTISVAESVTSGKLQAAFSLAPMATIFFQGGITAYNLQQKLKHLHVEPIQALQCNCVSQLIAEEMAVGCAKLFSSDWAVGITGYAEPIPEQHIDECFAFYALAHKTIIIDSGLVNGIQGNMEQVQDEYVLRVLHRLSLIK